MTDLAALPDRFSKGTGRSDARGMTALWWSLIAVIFCLALIGVGVFVLMHLGLEGVRPMDPRDAYFSS